ncbi:protein FAM234A [Aplysia californica]|uniref:Protein FAM234A n=1 Tax=Aplysia californica TaxID=6500 RepID=A0ABM0K0J7_APLCA|nr:protein FAM234A [Aplysia californica]
MAGILTNSLGGHDTVMGVFHQAKTQRVSQPWRTKFSDYGTESCVRLVDVDGDGLDDVVVGLAFGKDVTAMIVEETMDKYCQEEGLQTPCAGMVVALRGYDGKLLWKVSTYAEIFEVNCNLIDANGDGLKECVASGRLGTIYAIDIRTGKAVWEGDPDVLNRGWNIYSATRLPDFDGDGVNDIVIAHGGDPTVAAEIHNRRSGWLLVLSGATGKKIGQPLVMPEERETYCAPTLHSRRDGSQYVLFGSGGETVGGRFMAISVPDLYHHVTKRPSYDMLAQAPGEYGNWGFKRPGPDGVFTLFLSEPKGVMVPPVLVDMNKDGVKDVLMTAFTGAMVLYDGETMEVIWKIKLEERESYSTPAPGFFNDDDVLDFMVHWSWGAWPFYNTTDIVVLDGRDGTILWNVTSNKYDVSSDLVARTAAHHRDVFLFRLQGRHGVDPHNTGAIHGATGIQRIVRRSAGTDGQIELTESLMTDPGTDLTGSLLTEHHVRHTRASSDNSYVECESDQTVYLTEMFAVDRTSLDRPLKLWQKGSEKFYYKLTARDKQRVEEVMAHYGVNYTMTENEVPWSRGKRQERSVQKRDDLLPYCILKQPDERTTGAIGDVDGDGRLDVIVNVVSVGVIRDSHAYFVKMKFETDLYKFSLDDLLSQHQATPINVTVHDRLKFQSSKGAEPMTSLRFRPANEQIWGGYMGTLGDSVFDPASVEGRGRK